ncbi:MAG TPA: UDP-N-acetylmuramoyl-tripeptide--D-alanyl-D-alanine ligase, partial [Cupriavidus sp.]|nr:UDP-N-acetylmuramoyl-tripeptide--D-alanyl-D-alanine ligase [Cupriavidus sp.]
GVSRDREIFSDAPAVVDGEGGATRGAVVAGSGEMSTGDDTGGSAGRLGGLFTARWR